MSKVYQIVTDKIIEQLENGTAPWRKPWGGKWRHPRNLISGQPYRGINVFLLGAQPYDSPFWLTYKQAQKLGGHVRKGEKGSLIVFWTTFETTDKQTGEQVELPCLRYYTGFHVSQCNDIPADKIPQLPEPRNEFSPIERCEQTVAAYAGGPEVRNDFRKCFYRPPADLVGMPKPTAFDTPEEYYSTLFHELTHSTGHKSRLARAGIEGVAEFGSLDYGKEELIAEMGAAFLRGHCGIENATLDNSAAYLAGWLKTIKRDAKMVVHAAAAAQKAADWILGIRPAKADSQAVAVSEAA